MSVYHARIPVISVGNLSVGGNAKTPLSLYIAELCVSEGFRPVILTRGYMGKVRAPCVVKVDDMPERVGDEPLLMARRKIGLVVVCPDRVAGAKFIEQGKLGDVIILDDGFQHRRLGRNLDIVSVFWGAEDARRAFRLGELLPLGRFREDRDLALLRADALCMAMRSPDGEEGSLSLEQVPLAKPIPVFRSYHKVTGVFSVMGNEVLSPCRVVAFCGIANPISFFNTLSSLGFTLNEKQSYGDHHRFKEQDLVTLAKKHPLMPMVCTEKDAVKLESLGIPNLYYLKVSTRLDPASEFRALLLKNLGKAV